MYDPLVKFGSKDSDNVIWLGQQEIENLKTIKKNSIFSKKYLNEK